MAIKYLLQKEFLQIIRNPFLPKLIIVFPIMIMCVIPWVMNMEVKNIVVRVVDQDHSSYSQQLVHRLEASRYFRFAGCSATYEDALTEIRRGHADVALLIPSGYHRDLQRGEHPQLFIAANAVNGTKGAMGNAYLTSIVSEDPANPLPSLQQKASTLVLYNKHQDYKLYMVPALLALVVMLMTGFLPTLNIVGEKEAGTIEQINVTPVSKGAFILAKLIPYWLIAFFVATICLLLAKALYGLSSVGSVAWIYLLAMLLALFVSSFGLTISNFSSNMQQAVFVMWFFIVFLMLLSGLFTPVRSMPMWAYATTYINPMHYFIDAIRTVYIRGGGFREIYPHLLALSLLGSAMSICAVTTYRKNE